VRAQQVEQRAFPPHLIQLGQHCTTGGVGLGHQAGGVSTTAAIVVHPLASSANSAAVTGQ